MVGDETCNKLALREHVYEMDSHCFVTNKWMLEYFFCCYAVSHFFVMPLILCQLDVMNRFLNDSYREMNIKFKLFSNLSPSPSYTNYGDCGYFTH